MNASNLPSALKKVPYRTGAGDLYSGYSLVQLYALFDQDGMTGQAESGSVAIISPNGE